MLKLGFTVGVALLVLAAGGCDSDGDDTATSTSTGSTSAGPVSTSEGSGSTSAGSGSTTMGVVDGDAYCAQFETLDDCLGGSGADTACGWRDVATYDASCNELDATSLCLWIPVPGTDPGCGGFPATCPGEAFFRETAGGVEVSYECGGSYPDGFEPCPLMDVDGYSVAECNCGCLGGAGSSSSGGGTSSSGGGDTSSSTG